MSVLIMGMKMPEGCGECRFNGAKYCYAKGDENPKSKLPCPLVDQCCVSTMRNGLISRQAAITLPVMPKEYREYQSFNLDDAYEQGWNDLQKCIELLPSEEPEREDYTEMKQEFIRMASYIDVLLECSNEQKETLIGFISRLAEHMPWTERD